MPGCACISVSLHMIIQTRVLIETTKDLRSDLRWCSCNIFFTQYHDVAYIKFGESTTVFSYKGESIEEYWECIMNALICPEDDFKVHRPDLIVYDGVDMTLPIHEGKKARDFSSIMVLSLILATRKMLSSRLSKPSSSSN